MSEYPIECCRCNKDLGYIHATEYSNKYRCEECALKERQETSTNEGK